MTALTLDDAPETWRRLLENLRPGEELYVTRSTQPILRLVAVEPKCAVRDHTSFLNGYAAEDEGLYDDDPAR